MGNMIKLPYDEGSGNTGILALNVDGAIDVLIKGTDQLNITTDIFSWTATKYLQVELKFTDSTIDQDDADALLATIKRASQAPNSQPTFQPKHGGTYNTIHATGGISVVEV
tara:strand:- start:1230 stop:1562 length:333 start_codon:yes stop_codon:yes gene_type:complete